MKFLLDTCVISEIIRPKPSNKVIKWIKKEELHNWVENDLKERFWNRIINIDLHVAMQWGKIQGIAEKAGKPIPAIDSLIAATGIAHHLTVVTRNTTDMKESGVALLNPWG